MGPADIEAVRDWVGSDPDEDLIVTALSRLGDPARAALSMLRRRRADLAANRPGQWRIDGDVSETWRADQMEWVDRQIGRLEALVGESDPTGPSTVTVVPVRTPRGTR